MYIGQHRKCSNSLKLKSTWAILCVLPLSCLLDKREHPAARTSAAVSTSTAKVITNRRPRSQLAEDKLLTLALIVFVHFLYKAARANL